MYLPKMTDYQKDLEKKFEEAVNKQKKHHFDLSKPYMEEKSKGYDSRYTNCALAGFELGLKYEKSHKETKAA